MIENPELRNLVAREVKEARGYGGKSWKEHRGANEYLNEFKGLKEFLDYVKTLPFAKVLDIGTGEAIALNEIRRSNLGKGLEFEGTVLSIRHISSGIREKIKIHETFAESMRRIPDAEFGGVLSAYSIGYSEAPEEVIKNIDSKLIPGGAFKGTFSPEETGEVNRNLKLKPATLFYEAFKALGYDVILQDGVLLALKPGAKVKAEELMNKDSESVASQLIPERKYK